MREIKFRGKRVDNGEWVYGDLVRETRNHDDKRFEWTTTSIVNHVLYNGAYKGFSVAVIPETVGEYTGLKDKSGKEIYEGDFTRVYNDVLIIQWNQKYASFCLRKEGWIYSHFFGEAVYPENCEIIGNIHDNPEIMEGSNDGTL